MSASRKFQIIEERPVGTLDEDFHERWHKLEEKHDRIARAQKALNQATKRFNHELVSRAGLEEGEREAYRGFRVDPDGMVWRKYCACPACQASLQGLTVSVVVEEMIRQDLITASEITEIRKRAAELDAAKRAGIKKKQIQN